MRQTTLLMLLEARSPVCRLSQGSGYFGQRCWSRAADWGHTWQFRRHWQSLSQIKWNSWVTRRTEWLTIEATKFVVGNRTQCMGLWVSQPILQVKKVQCLCSWTIPIPESLWGLTSWQWYIWNSYITQKWNDSGLKQLCLHALFFLEYFYYGKTSWQWWIRNHLCVYQRMQNKAADVCRGLRVKEQVFQKSSWTL